MRKSKKSKSYKFVDIYKSCGCMQPQDSLNKQKTSYEYDAGVEYGWKDGEWCRGKMHGFEATLYDDPDYLFGYCKGFFRAKEFFGHGTVDDTIEVGDTISMISLVK